MHNLKKVAYVLVLIGALNWGLVGIFGFDLVTAIVGSFPMLVSIVYVVIGLSSLYLLIGRTKKCSCSKDECTCKIDVNKKEETEGLSE